LTCGLNTRGDFETPLAEEATEVNPGGCSVALMCRVLGVPRSTYYAHVARPVRQARAEQELVGEIRVHAGSRGAYGAPALPCRAGAGRAAINRKRVARLMREHGIAGITRRWRRGLTWQARRAMFAADLIGRDFMEPQSGMRLVGDMTELVTAEGKVSLATCIDLATREVVDWR
jgi:putative transposase